MKTIVIACKTLRDEALYAVKELNINLPILWIESGLHNTPERLHQVIQEQVNRIENVENILLLFGNCGNSLYNLNSPNARIVFPKVDDCISLLLGGNGGKAEWEKNSRAYYLTKGYLEMESNIWTEYKHSLDKYGPEMTKSIMATILKGYYKLRVIETDAYKLEDILNKSINIAERLELEHEVIEGTLRIVYKAFLGEWDKDFAIIEPGCSVGLCDLGLLWKYTTTM